MAALSTAFELDKIYCGDCTKIMADWPDACIDLTVTSPPYNDLTLLYGGGIIMA